MLDRLLQILRRLQRALGPGIGPGCQPQRPPGRRLDAQVQRRAAPRPLAQNVFRNRRVNCGSSVFHTSCPGSTLPRSMSSRPNVIPQLLRPRALRAAGLPKNFPKRGRPVAVPRSPALLKDHSIASRQRPGQFDCDWPAGQPCGRGQPTCRDSPILRREPAPADRSPPASRGKSRGKRRLPTRRSAPARTARAGRQVAASIAVR